MLIEVPVETNTFTGSVSAVGGQAGSYSGEAGTIYFGSIDPATQPWKFLRPRH